MNPTAASASARLPYPAGFRPRRGSNWGFLGLLYTSFYMCRYNLPLANKSISDEFGFSRADIGAILTSWALAYACGQIINGLLADRLGGKRTMLIGAAGTITMNVLFGAASKWGFLKQGHWLVTLSWLHLDLALPLLTLFIAIRGVDGYLQAFGAPGFIKINTAWFSHRERGTFSGIFGFVINLGRFGIFTLGPALLAGFTVLGLLHVPPLHWRWLFWAPSVLCALVALGMALTVKETPEEAGFHGVIPDDSIPGNTGARAPLGLVLRTIATNPVVWVTACAYACTGAVRRAVDDWFPRYMQDLYHADLKSAAFQFLAFLIPFVASVGSLSAGYVSDRFFKGHRAPVAAALYFLETAIIVMAAQFHTANAAVLFLVLISFTANSTHSILGSAAPMDIGGRRMAGFAVGLIDSFQYFGGSLAGYFLGKLLDKSLGNYFYFMVPFGVIGGVLMLTVLGKVTAGSKPEGH